MNVRYFDGSYGVSKPWSLPYCSLQSKKGGRTYTLIHCLFRGDHPGNSPFQYIKNMKQLSRMHGSQTKGHKADAFKSMPFPHRQSKADKKDQLIKIPT